MINTQSLQIGRQFFLYDAARLSTIDADVMRAEAWMARNAVLGGAPGRGTTIFVRDERSELALRHYRRGGLVGRLLADRYLWLGLDRTRPWREWQLSRRLYEMGLPVPRPVAAHCERLGIFYRANLLTERLPGRPLAEWLAEASLAKAGWQAVGQCLRRFHDAGVYHADLNARNILLDAPQQVYVLDFDKGELRSPGGSWVQQNLARLRRSLEKFSRQQPGFAFDEADWSVMMAAYYGDDGVTTS
ncbi:MAG: 3-deoxy-D-manno-octulosonic acid kinase [Chromatiales bacterium]|nr:3-deoxy-D-manno-octulosonic acid kinase [Chromatiales bacterium]